MYTEHKKKGSGCNRTALPWEAASGCGVAYTFMMNRAEIKFVCGYMQQRGAVR